MSLKKYNLPFPRASFLSFRNGLKWVGTEFGLFSFFYNAPYKYDKRRSWLPSRCGDWKPKKLNLYRPCPTHTEFKLFSRPHKSYQRSRILKLKSRKKCVFQFTLRESKIFTTFSLFKNELTCMCLKDLFFTKKSLLQVALEQFSKDLEKNKYMFCRRHFMYPKLPTSLN